MNRKIFQIILFAFSIFISIDNASAVDISSCPTTINVNQQIKDPPKGWTTYNSDGSHPFINISFSEGPPDQRIILAPTREKERAGIVISIWDFTPYSSDYWISCIYSETSAVVAKKLPKSITSCEVEYDKKFSTPVVKNFKCS